MDSFFFGKKALEFAKKASFANEKEEPKPHKGVYHKRMDERVRQKLFVDRPLDAIKNDFGKALLLGGSKTYPGSICLAALFASLSGDGYTAVGVPQEIYPYLVKRIPLDEIFENGLFEDPSKRTRILAYSSLLFGNGISESEENYAFLKEIILTYPGYLLLDAGALRLLAKFSFPKTPHPGTIVLTPHLGEAAALLQMNKGKRDSEAYLEKGRAFCKENNLFLLLKSHQSLLITPEGKAIASSALPNPSLARAGSGDCLAGFLAGLLAYAPAFYKIEEIILFADEAFHEAAAQQWKEKAPGEIRYEDVYSGLKSLLGQKK